MAGHPVTLHLVSRSRDLARLRRASVLLPEAGLLFFACPKKSNHRDGGNAKRNGTPDDAPSGRSPEGPRASYGVFRQDVRVLSKNWPASMPATLRAFLHSPAAVIRGPQEQEPKLAVVVFSQAPAPPLPNPLPQGEREKWGARRGRKSEAKARADAKRGSALSPQRFGRVAQRCGVPAVWPPMGVPPQPSLSVRAYPSTMLRAFALKAILFGLLFSWASKRKVTRAAAADRNARRAGGLIAVAPHKSEQRTRDNQAQSHWMTSLRLLKSASCFRRNDEQGRPLWGTGMTG